MFFFKEYDHCMLCPRKCGVNRNMGQKGYCGSDARLFIGSVCIHKGEEPAISGKKGICNVFFSRCNMQCLYCQNHQISLRKGNTQGNYYTLEDLLTEITTILNMGVEALGFVTPTHYTPHVKAIIMRLHELGYRPVTVYNTNSYDNTQIISEFEGLIDVYLPDFKYYNSSFASLYSDTPGYTEAAKASLKEMYRQKGSTVVLDDEGLAVTGLIIRHLVLPGMTEDSINILKWVASELSPDIHISLMSQYYPVNEVYDHPILGRRLEPYEYEKVVLAMNEMGFSKGWMQQPDSADYYKPDFGLKHPFNE